MIKLQLNALVGYGDFAFTLALPAVPRKGDKVHIGERKFLVQNVEWFPFTDWPVHLIAVELWKPV